MKGKALEITLWTTLIGSLIGLAFIAWRQQSTPMQPPRTPLISTPTTVGCTGSISFRIEEDGSVTSWCEGEVNN
jgi:hypothetical protein